MQLEPTYSIYRNDVLIREKPTSLTNDEKAQIIISTISEYGNVNMDMLAGAWRKREVCELRHIAMEFIKKNTGLSLVNIGVKFGGRDHSSVIHAVAKVGDLFDTDKQFREKYLQIQYLLSSKLNLINPKK